MVKYRVLIGKPGLDGHDRGAKFIARLLRDEGFEVIYTGIRHSAEEIASVAVAEDVAAIGLSSLSGAHLKFFPDVIKELKKRDASDIRVLGGGVIPEDDIPVLLDSGITHIYTPGCAAADIVETFRKACEAHLNDNAGSY